MMEFAREYPFLVPFLLVCVPLIFVTLVSAWLILLLKRGESFTLNMKGLGLELSMVTSLDNQSDVEHQIENKV
jgi:hypothetical protein